MADPLARMSGVVVRMPLVSTFPTRPAVMPYLIFSPHRPAETPSPLMVDDDPITAKIACPMDLRKYPLDEQNCTMELESYGYTTSEVTYDWKNGSASVQGLLNLELSQFTLVSYDTVLTKEVYET
ncbi:hypothetical protein Bbelb_182510, partial [Branchiostoma belcheri]